MKVKICPRYFPIGTFEYQCGGGPLHKEEIVKHLLSYIKTELESWVDEKENVEIIFRWEQQI